MSCSLFIENCFEGVRETLFTAGRWKAILNGYFLTLSLTWCSFFFGAVLAVLLCMGKRSRVRFVSSLTDKITVLCGGTPVLVLLMIMFYIIFPGVRFKFIPAAAAFSYAFGCYISDALASSVGSITEEEWNVTDALGLDRKTAFRKIYFRKVMGTFIPQTVGSALTILHLTSLAGAMSMVDATQAVNDIVAEIGRTVFPMIVLVALYLLASILVTKFIFFLCGVFTKKKDLLKGVDREKPVRPYAYAGPRGDKGGVILKFQHVKKSYGDNEVLKDVSGEVKRGSIVSLIGRSGSGKSTLFRLAAGLGKPDSGEILFPEQDREHSGAERRRPGIVFPDFCLFSDMTVLENLIAAPIVGKLLTPQEAFDKAASLLALMGLKDRADQSVGELSMGCRKRVSIARALMSDPEILLFDEPTAYLDPVSVGEIEFVMKSLAGSGLTMLISTHELSLVKEISDDVWFLEDGAVAESGAPAVFFEQQKTEGCRRYIRSMEILSGTLSFRSADLPNLYARIAFFCERNRLDPKIRYGMYRITEELLYGVICRRLPADQTLAYEGEYERKTNLVTLTVRYGGPSWDPFREEDSLEVLLVRKTVKDAEHSFRDGRNRLVLTLKAPGKVTELS